MVVILYTYVSLYTEDQYSGMHLYRKCVTKLVYTNANHNVVAFLLTQEFFKCCVR